MGCLRYLRSNWGSCRREHEQVWNENRKTHISTLAPAKHQCSVSNHRIVATPPFSSLRTAGCLSPILGLFFLKEKRGDWHRLPSALGKSGTTLGHSMFPASDLSSEMVPHSNKPTYRGPKRAPHWKQFQIFWRYNKKRENCGIVKTKPWFSALGACLQRPLMQNFLLCRTSHTMLYDMVLGTTLLCWFANVGSNGALGSAELPKHLPRATKWFRSSTKNILWRYRNDIPNTHKWLQSHKEQIYWSVDRPMHGGGKAEGEYIYIYIYIHLHTSMCIYKNILPYITKHYLSLCDHVAFDIILNDLTSS